MLGDAVRVYEALAGELQVTRLLDDQPSPDSPEKDGTGTGVRHDESFKLFILADTSYGACCVDEIAAEHVDAEAVVHYGRACLSPTARLPVVHVFTTRKLEISAVVDAFLETYQDKETDVIIMAELPYTAHLQTISSALKSKGYSRVYEASVIHDPSSPLPNRTVPKDVGEDASKLKSYELFHVGQPPTALLLTLSSRVGNIHMYAAESQDLQVPRAALASSSLALRRRYALVTSLSTVSVFGILINTLSVRNYLHIVDHVKEAIAAAGKKYYTFVVGKVNAAKIANFSEVGGWVVIGCWESSLVESADFYKPLITPFELQLALQSDSQRVWTGEWTSDFEAVLKRRVEGKAATQPDAARDSQAADAEQSDCIDDEESAPPEFDLRTGRYVSHSRPMAAATTSRTNEAGDSQASAAAGVLTKRANGELAQVGGVASPGAEYLRTWRTWQGLGSDFEVDYTQSGANGVLVEQGRSGIARGYADGQDSSRR